MEFRGLSFDEFSSEKVGQFSIKPHSSFELSDAQHDEHNNMLSFSSPKLDNKYLPFNHKNPGYASSEGMNTTKMCILNGLKWPFTTSQWIELEQQALIYKYIIANQPIPPNLLFPIIRANKSTSFCDFNGALLTPNNAYGWGAFHLGFSNNTDPEPGRCRRTDGKKWRCAREAVPDQKYCERHVNRGRHRSRKPVEPHSKHSVSRVATSKDNSPAQIPVNCSSSSAPLLVPENSSVYGAYDVNDPSNLLWPKTQAQYETTQLSISIPEAPSDYRSSTSSPTGEKVTLSPLRLSRDIDSIIQMGLGHCEHPNSVSLLSWKTSVGGPLGEALKTTSNGLVDHRTNLSGLSLLSNHWEGSVRSTSSQRTATVSLSNSSAGSSPQADSGKASENGRVISDKLSVL